LDMKPLKPFQFDTCYKVRFAVQFIQFLVVSNPPLTVILNWTIRFSLISSFQKYLAHFLNFWKASRFRFRRWVLYGSRFYKA
jgi:hypothetical protein